MWSKVIDVLITDGDSGGTIVFPAEIKGLTIRPSASFSIVN
jgi:hypothetical protein